MKKIGKVFKAKVFVNKKTKQVSIAIPKKEIKFVKHIPKELKLKIKGIKW